MPISPTTYRCPRCECQFTVTHAPVSARVNTPANRPLEIEACPACGYDPLDVVVLNGADASDMGTPSEEDTVPSERVGKLYCPWCYRPYNLEAKSHD